MKLGVSLYPEKETLEEMENYLCIASKYGFTQVFTSMFSVPGETEEVFQYFTNLCSIAHRYQFEVCVDANAEMFSRFGIDINDLSPFKKIGIDEIRMDLPYTDERDMVLINNSENIKIQMNSLLTHVVTPVVDQLEDASKISVCHNFFPERYSGMGLKEFNRLNRYWNEKGVQSTAFITSQNPKAHGPWPAFDGLPTCEDHRECSVDFQVREMLALGYVDCLIFGNAFATEEELQAARLALDENEKIEEKGPMEKMFTAIVPNLGERQIVFAVDEEKDISELERKIMYDYRKHCDVTVGGEYMHRSSATRVSFSPFKGTVSARQVDKPYFEKGDIMIVNETSERYHGELQICLQPMKNDGHRNLVGHLDQNEIRLLDYLTPECYFLFKRK